MNPSANHKPCHQADDVHDRRHLQRPRDDSGRRFARRYVLHHRIGGGALGLLYAGHDNVTDRPVAIHVLDPNVASDPEIRYRFCQAAILQTHPDHPHNPAILDVGQSEDGLLYTILDCSIHATLESLLATRTQPLPWQHVARIGLQVCAALANTHTHKLLHRDVHPGNCLLFQAKPNAPLTIKLLDLSLAGLLPAAGPQPKTKRPGAPDYLAPELIHGYTPDPRSDIYALGVMLYRLLTLRFPFTAKDPAAVMRQHLHDPVLPPGQVAPTSEFPVAEIPEAIESVVMQALAKDPSDRFPSAAAMATALGDPLGIPDDDDDDDDETQRVVIRRLPGPAVAANDSDAPTDDSDDDSDDDTANADDETVSDRPIVSTDSDDDDTLITARAHADPRRSYPDRPLFEDDDDTPIAARSVRRLIPNDDDNTPIAARSAGLAIPRDDDDNTPIAARSASLAIPRDDDDDDTPIPARSARSASARRPVVAADDTPIAARSSSGIGVDLRSHRSQTRRPIAGDDDDDDVANTPARSRLGPVPVPETMILVPAFGRGVSPTRGLLVMFGAVAAIFIAAASLWRMDRAPKPTIEAAHAAMPPSLTPNSNVAAHTKPIVSVAPQIAVEIAPVPSDVEIEIDPKVTPEVVPEVVGEPELALNLGTDPPDPPADPALPADAAPETPEAQPAPAVRQARPRRVPPPQFVPPAGLVDVPSPVLFRRLADTIAPGVYACIRKHAGDLPALTVEVTVGGPRQNPVALQLIERADPNLQGCVGSLLARLKFPATADTARYRHTYRL